MEVRQESLTLISAQPGWFMSKNNVLRQNTYIDMDLLALDRTTAI